MNANITYFITKWMVFGVMGISRQCLLLLFTIFYYFKSIERMPPQALVEYTLSNYYVAELSAHSEESNNTNSSKNLV